MNSIPTRPDILLVTVTEIETKALISGLIARGGSSLDRYAVDGVVVHDLGKLTHVTVCHAQCATMGSSTPGGSHDTLRSILPVLKPAAVILLGIAAGFDPKKQRLGQIIVSQQVASYEPMRMGKELIRRGYKVPASDDLLQYVHSACIDWTGAEIIQGLLLSGEKLIDDLTFRNALLADEPEAVGLDMEAHGLVVATRKTRSDWIVIKAISDFADGNKRRDKAKRQARAAKNAVEFVLHMIERIPPRSSPAPDASHTPRDIPPSRKADATAPDTTPEAPTLPNGPDDSAYWAAEIAAGSYSLADGRATVQLGPFRIARYAVTVGQYQQFVAAGSYTQPQLWTAQGWEWAQCHRPPTLPTSGVDLPVTRVCWYEALAFCAWLNRLRPAGAPWMIGLPTEAEWEVAARWDAAAQRMISWAFPDHPPHQNVSEAGHSEVVAVSRFAEGASPCGAVGMAGNVWEWCNSSYAAYPGVAAPLADLAADAADAPMRGGAYNMSGRRSGWDARMSAYPIIRRHTCGLRLCLRLPLHSPKPS